MSRPIVTIIVTTKPNHIIQPITTTTIIDINIIHPTTTTITTYNKITTIILQR